MGQAVGVGGFEDASSAAKDFERGSYFAGGLNKVEAEGFEDASGLVGLHCQGWRDGRGWLLWQGQALDVESSGIAGCVP